MTTAHPWPSGLPGFFVVGLCALSACVREPDPGGQEGEEVRVAAEDDDGTAGGGGPDTGEGGEVGDLDVDRISGQREHLRGEGEPGAYDCELYWSMEGDAGADGCPECRYTFNVTFRLDPLVSDRIAYACDDVYSDEAAVLGVLDDYYGYGPAVVGIYEGTSGPYMLGFAWIDGPEVGWSYGYIDEAWWDDGVYYTWFFEVTARTE